MSFEDDYYPPLPVSPRIHNFLLDDEDSGNLPKRRIPAPSSIPRENRDSSGNLVSTIDYQSPTTSDSSKRTPTEKLIDRFGETFQVTISPKKPKERGRSADRPSFVRESLELKESISGIRLPYTLPFANYDGNAHLYPVVAKNETASGGRQKYLIDDQIKLNRLREWMGRYGNYSDWVAQQYIETPSDSPCSFRVVVDCTGSIVSSQIIYGPSESQDVHLDHPRVKDKAALLEDSSSPYFLNAQSVASNKMFDAKKQIVGGRLTLDRREDSHPYGERDLSILQAHKMTADTAHLPEEIATVAKEIGVHLGKLEGKKVHGDLVVGLDFLQNVKDRQYYLVELNRRPSMAGVRDYFGGADAMTNLGAWQYVLNRIMTRITQAGTAP